MDKEQVIYVDAEHLVEKAKGLRDTGMRFVMAYLNYKEGSPEVIYLLDQGKNLQFLELVVSGQTRLPSLAEVAPLLSWYEREIMDLSNIEFEGSPEPYPLVLLEGMSLSIGPFDPRSFEGPELAGTPEPLKLPEVMADQVQDLFWGPVRGDVLESGEFHFAYIGEQILHYTPRLFYKHRGIEYGLQGKDPLTGTIYAERVSGVGSITHGLAYCNAVENALSLEIPQRAKMLRIVLAELERIYNNLHFFGLLCKTTTLKVGESFGMLLEEEAKQINAKVSGNRLLRNALCVGGLSEEIQVSQLESSLKALQRKTEDYLDSLFDTQSHLDRLIGTGVLSSDLALEFGATGPVANASGIARDLRVDHPYSAYEKMPNSIPTRTTGDAFARSEIRRSSLMASFDTIHTALSSLPSGALRSEVIDFNKGVFSGLGWSEGPRGSCYYAVHIRDGKLERVKVKSASFSNWKVFPLTVHSTNMMDYAINEASFGLTIAGTDR